MEDRKYRITREKKYQEAIMNLNTSHFIDRPFSVILGLKAAWLEFRIAEDPESKPNQEILSQMMFSKPIS